jgi:DNA repair protein RecN (Recombination protein N)
MQGVLQELHVRNLGILEEAGVAFSDGLNVITGETGAGKTLLLSSIQLLTGARAESRLLGPAGDEATVEAIFSAPQPMRERLAERGLDDGEDVVVARRLGSDGRSRAWVGGRLVPVSTLAELCIELIEVHGQGAAFALARPGVQLAALDALAGLSESVAKHRELVVAIRALEAERERLRAAERTREREIEILAYQAEEIERAAVQDGEDERLIGEIARLEHAERLWASGARVLELAGPDGAAGQLAEAHRALEDASRVDPSVAPLVTRLGSLAAEAAEAAWDLRGWADALEPDPPRLEALRERAALLATLKRKYGGSVADVISAGSVARGRLDELQGADERSVSLDAEIDALTKKRAAVSDALTKRRTAAAREMESLVRAELPALAMPNAVFEIACERLDEPTESGVDKVEFRFSASAQRAPDVLGKVASGGELSRAMIAVTLSLAAVHGVPVLVFDEADQGIGGEAALDLARRLQRLGQTHQVLVVTHLPQIAAFADRHVVVRQGSGGVEVEVLDDDRRVAEVSRMLAGLESSQTAQAHAAELVELGRAREPAAAG